MSEVAQSFVWEGETTIGRMRDAIKEMDERFVAAMAREHAALARPVRTKERPPVAPVAKGPVSKRPLSIHEVDEADEIAEVDADMALVSAILRRPSANRAISAVAERTGVSPYRIAGKSRSHEVMVARSWVFFLMSEDGYSYARIGKMFGKDPTTVRYGVMQHMERAGLQRPPKHQGYQRKQMAGEQR